MATNPLTRKLGVKPEHRLLVLDPPAGYPAALEPLPEGAQLATQARGTFDAVVVFVRDRAAVARRTDALLRVLRPDGLLWLAYPKKTSGVATDISRDAGWEPLRAAGWRPVSLVSLDDTWSALRFRPEAAVKSRK